MSTPLHSLAVSNVKKVDFSTGKKLDGESLDSANTLFRKPLATDGLALNRLIEQSPPLDTNSVYCNLLQCTHFADTSICAEQDGRIVGFISGYRVPDNPNILFVWQVVVASECRGQGMGIRMLTALVERLKAQGVNRLHTTISPDNQSSWALFKKLARTLDAHLNHNLLFSKQRHFEGAHEDEVLVDIGPFT